MSYRAVETGSWCYRATRARWDRTGIRSGLGPDRYCTPHAAYRDRGLRRETPRHVRMFQLGMLADLVDGWAAVPGCTALSRASSCVGRSLVHLSAIDFSVGALLFALQ
jgi:hypothetical protein